MFAELARYLHQRIDDMLEWDVDLVFLMHEQLGLILDAEKPKKG